jgi:hypothetical protein
MSKNAGSIDRILRGAVGVVLIGMVLFAGIANPALFWGAVIVGAVMLITAITGFCPAYRLFGFKTCRDC